MRMLWSGRRQPEPEHEHEEESSGLVAMSDVELIQYCTLHERRMNTALDRRDFAAAYAARVVQRLCVEELDARELKTLGAA